MADYNVNVNDSITIRERNKRSRLDRFYQKENNATTTLTDNPFSVGATTLNVADGSVFPSRGDFLLTLWSKNLFARPGSDSGMEIVKCTSRSGNVLTVVRAQEGTADVQHALAEAVELLITKASLTEYETQLNNCIRVADLEGYISEDYLKTNGSNADQDLNIGAYNYMTSGDVGKTGARVNKGWFDDVEVTNVVRADTGFFTSATQGAGVEITIGKTVFWGTQFPSLILRTGTDAADGYLAFATNTTDPWIQWKLGQALRFGPGGATNDPDAAFVSIVDIDAAGLHINADGDLITMGAAGATDYKQEWTGGTDIAQFTISTGNFRFIGGNLQLSGNIYDTGPTLKINMASEELVNSAGQQTVLWGTNDLVDATNGLIALGWENDRRFLYANDGSDVILNWSTVGLADFNDSEIQTSGIADVGSLETDIWRNAATGLLLDWFGGVIRVSQTFNLNSNDVTNGGTINAASLTDGVLIISSGSISNGDDLDFSTGEIDSLEVNTLTAYSDIRALGDIFIDSDSKVIGFGAASPATPDATIGFDGNSLNIIANVVTGTDTLNITAASVELGSTPITTTGTIMNLADNSKHTWGLASDLEQYWLGTGGMIDPRVTSVSTGLKIGIGTNSTAAEIFDITGHLNFDQVANPTDAMGTTWKAGLSETGSGSSFAGGTYHYDIYFVCNDGTSYTIDSNTYQPDITISAGSDITHADIPISPDPRVTGRVIMRNEANESYHLAQLVHTLNDNTTTTWVDDGSVVGTGAISYRKVNDTAGIIKINGAKAMQVDLWTTALGIQALNALAGGYDNVAVGFKAGYLITTGANNISIGTLANEEVATATNNIAIGIASNANNLGSANVAVGSYACKVNTNTGTCNYNVGIGERALYLLETGDDRNTAIGYRSGYRSSGEDNVFIGYKAGYGAARRLIGDDNIIIGSMAADNIGANAFRNIIIGANLDLSVIDVDDELNIGGVIYGNMAGSKYIHIEGDLILPKTSGVGIKVDNITPTFGWRDLEGFEISDPTGGDRPTLSVYSGGLVKENAFSNGDILRIRYHIPHDYVKGTDILSHIHWSHNGTAISGNVVFGVTTDYAKGHNQANFGNEKSVSITYNTVNISTTPRYRQRIEEELITSDGGSASLIDRDLLEPDGIILVTFEVTTNPTISGGSPNNVFVHRADLHYQSTNIATKDKAPDFYA